MPTGIYPRQEVCKRFFAKVKQSDGCWNWTGSCGTNWGYGEFWFNGKKMLAHRYSWLIHNGEIPVGMMILHRCDNPTCVNPKHLWMGTNSDNMKDMYAKGRNFKDQFRRGGRFAKRELVKLAREGL